MADCFWSMFLLLQIEYCSYDFSLDLNPPNLKLISSPDVIEGSSLVLSCEVDASKPIIYQWYKGSQQVQGQLYPGIKKLCQEKLTANCLNLTKKTTWIKRTAVTVATSPLENERWLNVQMIFRCHGHLPPWTHHVILTLIRSHKTSHQLWNDVVFLCLMYVLFRSCVQGIVSLFTLIFENPL